MNPRPQPPAQIRWAGIIAIAQSVIAFAFAGFLVFRDITGAEERSLVSDSANIAWVGTGTAVFMAIIFGTVTVGAVSMIRGHKWGRGPVVLLEIILLGVAYFMFTGGAWPLGVVTAISAVVALAFLFNRNSFEWAETVYRT
ncbi:hypothetical protein CETAM_03295 [Corynebacterium comes]|uniref:Integral membrane protein n=1 Tax=Corynebacterium comes TaxID=2675218 RepID=A0A6B8VLL0_9CORY|nr:hypothetical protein CETAM_03295 [Corynebacterium comes]